MLCEFYRLRANSIVSLVEKGKYEADIAQEEVLLIMDSLHELKAAEQESYAGALASAQAALVGLQGALVRLTELGGSGSGGGDPQ